MQDFNHLWHRLQAWSPDELGATFPYSVRLARENGWTLRYAQRVVLEYKRFLALAASGEQPVCPAEAVDEAWHLHLCYTRSYWDELCGEILQQPLHHQPTRGGAQQLAHHQAMYAYTLETYRRAFGQEPPTDIWPAVAERFGTKGRFLRVHRARHWLLPKPPWRSVVKGLSSSLRRYSGTVVLAAIPVTLATMNPLTISTMNPLNMRGPQFLLFYGALLFCSILAGYALRTMLRVSDDRQPVPKLDAMQIAVLNGGERFASQVALADLVASDAVDVEDDSIRKLVAKQALDVDRPLMTRAIYEAISESELATPSFAAEAAAPETARIAAELEELGLLETTDSANSARWCPGLLMALVLLLGVAKIAIGLSRGRPILILVFLCIAAGIAMVSFFKRPFRTKRGERVLEEVRESHLELKDPRDLLEMSDTELLLGMGLFGLAPLSHAEGRLDKLNEWLGPTADPNSSWGSSFVGDSGCGGGGDGGGCGGGCGGCGD